MQRYYTCSEIPTISSSLNWSLISLKIASFSNHNRVKYAWVNDLKLTKLKLFQREYCKVYETVSKQFFLCQNQEEIKQLFWLGLNSSHLRNHEFRHSFQGTLVPVVWKQKQLLIFILQCPCYQNERQILLTSICNMEDCILGRNESHIIK